MEWSDEEPFNGKKFSMTMRDNPGIHVRWQYVMSNQRHPKRILSKTKELLKPKLTDSILNEFSVPC